MDKDRRPFLFLHITIIHFDLHGSVTEDEIIQLVNNAKNKTSKGHDEFHMSLHHLNIFSTHHYRKGFPDSMTKTRVIPLFKSGDVKEFSNYRPVSFLPQFSIFFRKGLS